VRLAFIDNIRWTMILLVLSMHASDTYSPFGSWYYTDRGDAGFGTIITFALYQTFLQAFFMALLFFIAGYFAAPAFDRKGLLRFSRERFIRLGLPTLLYMLVIGPLTQYFPSKTWGSGGFGHQWLVHLRDGEWLSETGPMWFCAALLALSLAYALMRGARRQWSRAARTGRTAGRSSPSSPAWRWRRSWSASSCPKRFQSSTCIPATFPSMC
jgi:hypothetical protein